MTNPKMQNWTRFNKQSSIECIICKWHKRKADIMSAIAFAEAHRTSQSALYSVPPKPSEAPNSPLLSTCNWPFEGNEGAWKRRRPNQHKMLFPACQAQIWSSGIYMKDFSGCASCRGKRPKRRRASGSIDGIGGGAKTLGEEFQRQNLNFIYTAVDP